MAVCIRKEGTELQWTAKDLSISLMKILYLFSLQIFYLFCKNNSKNLCLSITATAKISLSFCIDFFFLFVGTMENILRNISLHEQVFIWMGWNQIPCNYSSFNACSVNSGYTLWSSSDTSSCHPFFLSFSFVLKVYLS